MFTFFTRIFIYSWCRMPQIIKVFRPLTFFVNYRIFPGGSMGKIIGRGMYAEYFAIYFKSRRLAIVEAEEIVLSSRIGNFLSQNNRRTRIPRWLGRENEENVARTRNCCGWPSSFLHSFDSFTFYMFCLSNFV